MSKTARMYQIPELGLEKQKKRIDGCPISMRNLFQRVYAQKASLRLCVKAFCLECNGLDRKAITDCTAYACPLWFKRPYQQKVMQ